MATSVEGGSWYKLSDDGQVVCGECARDMLQQTEKGIYTGDEAVTLSLLTKLEDADTEPYQCDQCLLQNEAYDEVGEDD